MFLQKFTLSIPDYLVIGMTLVVSSTTGLFFQFLAKKRTNEEYFLANKNMALLPVIFSLMATFMSATTLMGIPAEMYLFGTNMAFMNIGFIIGPIISAYVFLPVYFSTDVSTVYEYLEKRFGKTLKTLISVAFIIQVCLFTSVTLYAPALTLSAVTDLSLWVSIVSIGVVCTFYCTLGGIKAVLWADVFQAILMYICLAVIIIKGCIDLGGVGNVFRIANEGGRIILPSVSMDIEAQYTLLNIFFQGIIISASNYGAGQEQVQRLRTLKDLSRSRKATFWSILLIVLFHLQCCFCGLIFYVHFINCDPMKAPNEPIHSPDQLMPYFITSVFHDFWGLPGLCIAGIFSASLSTVSSSLNSLTAVTVEDFLRQIWPKYSENVLIAKFISFVYGILSIAFSFLLASIGNLIKMTLIIVGMVAGPILGVFILAACTKATNEQGAVFGVTVSLVVAAFLSFIPSTTRPVFLPLSNECPEFKPPITNITAPDSMLSAEHNLTLITQYSNITIDIPLKSGIPVSYMWISTIALLTCIIGGYFGSIIFTFFHGKSSEVPDLYLSPVRTFFSKRSTIEKKETSEETVAFISEKTFSKVLIKYEESVL